jgi:Na+-translocating ferredoxin:NAD+ oxidoreductase RnfA subunit
MCAIKVIKPRKVVVVVERYFLNTTIHCPIDFRELHLPIFIMILSSTLTGTSAFYTSQGVKYLDHTKVFLTLWTSCCHYLGCMIFDFAQGVFAIRHT